VSTIRPTGFPPVQQSPTPARSEAARLEAQRAFFQMATGQAQAAAPARPSLAAAAPANPPPVSRIPSNDAEPPARILRPGSLLDIRV
jgi:hypothetical protein